MDGLTPDHEYPISTPDQGLHCLPFHLNHLDIFLYGKTSLNFSEITANNLGFQKFRYLPSQDSRLHIGAAVSPARNHKLQGPV